MPTTLPLTDPAKARLEVVAAWLEAGAPHREVKFGMPLDGFDMDVGVQPSDCGAVCCIAGALVQFNRPCLAEEAGGCGEVMWTKVRGLAIEQQGVHRERFHHHPRLARPGAVRHPLPDQ